MSKLGKSFTGKECIRTTADDPANLSTLPSEVRNKIYELVLVYREPLIPFDPWDVYNLEDAVALLCVNRAVHGEASSIFYAQNRFDFSTGITKDITRFLEQIGSNNAAYIRHICIEFPRFSCLAPGGITLEEDCIGVLADISSNCTNLSTLTTSLCSTDAIELDPDDPGNPLIADEALRLVHAEFKTISTVADIIVKVYEDRPNDHVKHIMQSYGWIISTTEHIEVEEDWSRGWSDDEYRLSDYHDDYDIDNDSDFWRRAAD